jgi:hypothetical protein
MVVMDIEKNNFEFQISTAIFCFCTRVRVGRWSSWGYALQECLTHSLTQKKSNQKKKMKKKAAQRSKRMTHLD